MLFVNILFLAGFAWPSTHLLLRYLRGEEEKPARSAVAGIVTVTVVMVAFLIWLMANAYFY